MQIGSGCNEMMQGTPLQFASVLGNVGAVQSLLLFGADPEKVREKRGDEEGRGGEER